MQLEAETVSVLATTSLTSLSRSRVYQLLASGDLQSVKVGRRRLVRLDSIRRLTAAQAAA